MKRKFLAAAVALAPLLAAGAGGARAAPTEITTATTQPVQTATANNGAPNDIDISASGSISPTAPGAAVTLNSNNVVTSEGAISFKDVSNATGILVDGGFTGQVTNTGPITLTESYTPTDTNNDGVLDGPFAQGSGRVGILVLGASPFTGGITSTGAINIQGNTSEGISIQAPITGNLLMLTVTPPATTGGTSTVANGSITITGDNTIGVQVAPTGAVGGNVRITGVTARGVGAQGVAIDGAVGGGINISGFVSASGYRSTVRPTNPTFSQLYTADELQQGGPAVSIGANVGGGLIVSAAPTPLSTTNLDQDGDGVPDAQQGNGNVTSYGQAPALQIGATQSVTLGAVGTGANAYGLVIQGSVNADGIYDPLITPNLPGVVPATAIQIGGAGDGAATLVGGLHNSGSILANAYQADATAIHLGAGANVATLLNDGSITAASTQVNSSTTAIPASGGLPAIPAPVAVNVTDILIDPGASVTSILNNRAISATISGTGGVGGTAAGIVDKSGSVTSVVNTGNIVAGLNQTFVTTPMPGTLIGIDISAGKSAQSITQDLAPGVAAAPLYVSTSTYAIGATAVENGVAYRAVAAVAAGQDPLNNPTLWVEFGTTAPSIVGSVLFGSGGSAFTINAGTVTADTIDLGAGVNTLTVNGAPPTVVAGVVTPGTVVTGALKDEGNYTLTVNVQSGTLSDTNPGVINARSVNVGANGVLLVSADPANNTNTLFKTSGASTFATGAQVGLTLLSVQSAPTQTYTILQTVAGQGTLNAGTFGTSSLANAPYLYTATASVVPGAPGASSDIDLTVARKTAAQLNFNAAEGSALNAVLAAIPADANIQKVILAQTTEAGLKSAYDQLLPDQGQGLFDSLDAAAQAISSMTGTTPDAGTRVAGSSLWLQEVNERVDRRGIDTLGSTSKLFGVVGGYERMGPAGGALGVTLAYLNSQEEDAAAAVGEHVVGSMVEAGLYYRRTAGPLSVSARGAGGYSWFSGDRRFLAPGAINVATSSWGGFFVDAHAQASYEKRFGVFYIRPQLSVDYLRLNEGARDESGGGAGFDLNVANRTSTRFSGQAIMIFGRQWGRAQWLRTEVRAGYREIFAGDVGDTVANFAGGTPFTLAADPDKGGWATVGFSLKGGTQYSYVALEGDADFRDGEQRYDIRVAGRSMF